MSGTIAACGIRVVHVPEQELPILGAAYYLSGVGGCFSLLMVKRVFFFFGGGGKFNSMPVNGKQSGLVFM